MNLEAWERHAATSGAVVSAGVVTLPAPLAARARELWEGGAPAAGAVPVKLSGLEGYGCEGWAWRLDGRIVSVSCWCCGDWCSPEGIDFDGLCPDCA